LMTKAFLLLVSTNRLNESTVSGMPVLWTSPSLEQT
jgi:hypothetical protein